MYSGHYPGTFVAPKNERNAETKRRSGAVPIPLLALSASMTTAYSSLGHLRIHSFLQEQAVKQPSVEYRLCKDDTQAETMAPDRLFYITQAAFELQKSNAD